jgi:hypothetical protein
MLSDRVFKFYLSKLIFVFGFVEQMLASVGLI